MEHNGPSSDGVALNSNDFATREFSLPEDSFIEAVPHTAPPPVTPGGHVGARVSGGGADTQIEGVARRVV